MPEQNIEGRLAVIEAKLDQTLALAMKIRRTQRNATYAKAAYWIFIILLGLGAFYFIQPLLNQFKSVYDFTGDSRNVEDIFQQFKETQ